MPAAAPGNFFSDHARPALGVAICSAGVLLFGCRSTRPPVSSLTPDQESTIRSTFRALGEGHAVSSRPTVPAEGWRWSDVVAAAKLAAGDVEAAVMRAREFVDEDGRAGWRFTVTTIEDWPGELVVVRTEGKAPGYRATATIGLYRDRAERAARFVEAFESRLRALGRVARYDD